MRVLIPAGGLVVDGLAFPAGELEVNDRYWGWALRQRGAELVSSSPAPGIPDLPATDDGAVLSGVGPPGDDVGEIGDSYVDMATGDVYRRE